MTISVSMQILVGVIVGVCSYFLGNINSAIMLSKMKGRDIRTCGSGNPGTMNMLRSFGKPMGALTLVLDVSKGVIPALLGWLFMGNGEFLRLGSDRMGLYVAGLCTEIGHIYPVIMKFKGGKGIATVFGVCMVAQPIAMVASFAIGVVFLLGTKIGSLTSFAMICTPLTLEGINAVSGPLAVPCVILVFAMFALTLFAHRPNLAKLFSGNERQVVLVKPKNKKPPADSSILFDNRIIAE